MRFFVSIALFLFSLTLVGQTYSESDIKKLANKINEQLRGLDVGNGIIGKGCFSVGRTLIYQYEVPSFWEPPLNIKGELIANLKAAGAAKNYFLYDIDVDYYYYKGNSLAEKVSINSNELSIFNYELGEYLSIKEHAKSKDVNLKLKAPQGWEVREGDRPNIVKKFTKDLNTYLILIKDNVTFFSRSETKEILRDESYVNEFIEEFSSAFKNITVIDKSVVNIDTYPALKIKLRGETERGGINMSFSMIHWIVFYEDKIVFLQGIGLDNAEFRALEPLYFLVTNSVIFPEQYN